MALYGEILTVKEICEMLRVNTSPRFTRWSGRADSCLQGRVRLAIPSGRDSALDG